MYILTRLNLFPSARALRNTIENLTGYRMNLTTSMGESEKGKRRTVGIRWGNGDYIPEGIIDKELNSPALIRTFANKQLFSMKFMKDFWVPEFHKETPDSSVLPILIRTTLTGMGGIGILPCATMEDFKRNWSGIGVWTQYHELTSEFRVHVIDGEVIRIFRKVRDSASDETSKFNIRNSSRGWHFELTGSNGNSLVRLKELAGSFWDNAKGKFDVKHGFFGLDVGWSRKNGKYFILEGNTAPSLAHNENTLNSYANKFIDILGL
jgi:hypothetical protein